MSLVAVLHSNTLDDKAYSTVQNPCCRVKEKGWKEMKKWEGMVEKRGDE